MSDPRELAFILNEMKILSVIVHPDCIKLFAVYEDESWLYLVTNVFTGAELLLPVLIKDGLALPELLRHSYQLLRILEYLETKKIIHHDIKPQNLIFRDSSESADICLIDFGLAVQLKDGQSCVELNGTKGFIAPEVSSGLGHDYKADIFSAGVVIYFMFTAEIPDILQLGIDNHELDFNDRARLIEERILLKTYSKFSKESNFHLT